MRIGIDVDGVCYPFTDVFRLYMETTFGRKLPAIHRWDFYKDWGMTDEEFAYWMYHGCEDEIVFHYGTPPRGCIETLEVLGDEPHEIALITNRPDYAEDATREWVHRWGIPHDELIITKTPKSEYGLDVLLDDSPSIIEDFREKGGKAIVFVQPWNFRLPGPRVTDWAGFGELLCHGW